MAARWAEATAALRTGRPAEAVRLIKPEEGLLLLFPSYFYHRAVPFESTDVRVSIAFDVLARD